MEETHTAAAARIRLLSNSCQQLRATSSVLVKPVGMLVKRIISVLVKLLL